MVDVGVDKKRMCLDQEEQADTFAHPYLILLGVIAFFLLTFVAGAYFFKFNGSLSESQDVWGQFGDFLGGTLNPVFAFLSLFALLYTITLQIKALKTSNRALRLSNEELKETRKIIKEQRDIQSLQKKLLEIQVFDNHFFNSLDLMVDVIQSAQDHSTNQIRTGFHAYSIMSEKLRYEFHKESFKNIELTNIEKNEYQISGSFWNEYSSQVYGFFNLVLSILEDIDSHAEDDRQSLYVSKLSSVLAAEHKYVLYGISLIYLRKGTELFEKFKFFDGLKVPKNFSRVNREVYPHIKPKHEVE